MNEINLKLNQRVALDFTMVKNYVSNKWGKRASNFDVVVELIQAFKDRKKLITEFKSLQRKLTEKDSDIMGLLRDSINRPINIQVGALAQATTNSWEPPKPVKHIEGMDTQRKDLLSEMKQKFIPENVIDGQLRPSMVIEKHEETVINNG